MRARREVRPAASEDPNPILQTGALCAPRALGFVKSAGSPPHCADLHFPSLLHAGHRYFQRQTFGEACGEGPRGDRHRQHCRRRCSSSPGLAWRGCRPFVRPASVVMPCEGANGACRRPSKRACPAHRTPSRARQQYRDPHILGALVHAVSTVSHLYVTGGLCYVQWSTQTFSHSWLC